MKIISKAIQKDTKGNPDLINISVEIEEILESSGFKKGNLTVFVVGSTAGVTTFEYEPGLIQDIREFYEKIIPSDKTYKHDETWGDANGFSHVRASIQGPSLVIPFEDGKLLLGTWQQVVLAEFDNRPRKRKIIIQLIGE